MIDPELIRRCVERADGWSLPVENFGGNGYCWIESPNGWRTGIDAQDAELIDALAAQLVRQFLASYEFGEHCLTVDERGASLGTDEHLIDVYGSDLTETTLKAIDQFYEEQ